MSDAIDRKFVMTPLAAGVIAALSPISATQAQESDESSKTLDEITVTATRRELNLQNVAQSITAFSSKDIADMGVRSMADYIKAMPSVALTDRSNAAHVLGRTTPFPDIVRYLRDINIKGWWNATFYIKLILGRQLFGGKLKFLSGMVSQHQLKLAVCGSLATWNTHVSTEWM